MSSDTLGRIKGYVSHEDITDFIRNNWDPCVTDGVGKRNNGPLSKVNWKHELHEHSEDNENWYDVSGFINFTYNGNRRRLFYFYENINNFENLEYYAKRGLEDMINTETTRVNIGAWGDSVEIITEIIKHFGGGWIDENDCDDNTYHFLQPEDSMTNAKTCRKKGTLAVTYLFAENDVIQNSIIENKMKHDLQELAEKWEREGCIKRYVIADDKVLDEALTHQLLPDEECTWKLDETDFKFNTSCGNKHNAQFMGLYCIECGRKIRTVYNNTTEKQGD